MTIGQLGSGLLGDFSFGDDESFDDDGGGEFDPEAGYFFERQISDEVGLDDHTTSRLRYSPYITSDNTSLTVLSPLLPSDLRVQSVVDAKHYRILPSSPGAFPVSVVSARPITSLRASGFAQILGSQTIRLLDQALNSNDVGQFLFLSSPLNTVNYARITSVLNFQDVVIDTPLVTSDPVGASSQLPFELRSIDGVTLTITKPTGRQIYRFEARLQKASGQWVQVTDLFEATATRPKVTGSTALDDGQILVTFSESLLHEPAYLDPRSYDIDTSDVQVLKVRPGAGNQVVLETAGLSSGGFSVSVNDPRTLTQFPKDLVATTDLIINQLNVTATARTETDTLSFTESLEIDYGVMNRVNIDQIEIDEHLTMGPHVMPADRARIYDHALPSIDKHTSLVDAMVISDLVQNTATSEMIASDTLTISDAITPDDLVLSDVLSLSEEVTFD